jgi:hypothetical protein
VQDKAQQLYDEIDAIRKADLNDINRKFQQIKVEHTEALIELSDNHKREIRDMRHSIDKNTEDVEFLMNSLKNLRRRNEDITREEPIQVRKSSPELSSIHQKVDDQVNDRLFDIKSLLKSELKRDYEVYVDEAIEYNNKNFVVPTVENYSDKTYIKRSERDSVASIPKSARISERDVEKLKPEIRRVIQEELGIAISQKIREKTSEVIRETIEEDVPQICKRVMKNDLELACRQMMEREVEPICKQVMIEEYARTRRNIVEKEIEPTCREIMEEEMPTL